jgi:hypothetical protein
MSPAGETSEISGVAVPAGAVPGGLAPIAGGSPEADQLPHTEVVFVAVLFAALCVVFGILPSPLFHLASHAGAALGLF